MDYLSILISGVFGMIGAGLGYFVMTKITTNKNFITSVSVIVSILFYQVLKPIVYEQNISPVGIRPEMYNKLSNNIDKMNKNLPKMMDEATRLEAILVDKGQLIYKYMILDTTIKVIDIKNREQLIKKNTCNLELSKKVIDNGIEIVYHYTFKNNSDEVILHFTNCLE